MGAQHGAWHRAGTPHVTVSFPSASTGLFSHLPSTPALPKSRVWRNARWKVLWQQKGLPCSCRSWAQCSFHPAPQQMGRLLQSLGLPVRGEVLLTHPAQTSPPSQGFNPVPSVEAVSRAPRMGWEGQAKILNAYSHSVPATQSARAGTEASVLPFPKPVNRDLPALKALEEWGGFFCSDVKLL